MTIHEKQEIQEFIEKNAKEKLYEGQVQYDHQSIRQRLCNIFPVAKIPIPIGGI